MVELYKNEHVSLHAVEKGVMKEYVRVFTNEAPLGSMHHQA